MVAGEVPFHLPGAAEVYKVIISQCFQPMLTLQISNLGMKSLKLCLSCGRAVLSQTFSCHNFLIKRFLVMPRANNDVQSREQCQQSIGALSLAPSGSR